MGSLQWNNNKFNFEEGKMAFNFLTYIIFDISYAQFYQHHHGWAHSRLQPRTFAYPILNGKNIKKLKHHHNEYQGTIIDTYPYYEVDPRHFGASLFSAMEKH